MVRYETTSKLFFLIDLFKSSYQNNTKLFFPFNLSQSSYQNNTLRHKSTKTLMSPRYSNVTSSICGYDYTICIAQSQIHLFNQHRSTSKSALKFLPESKDENVCQPLCIGSWAGPTMSHPQLLVLPSVCIMFKFLKLELRKFGSLKTLNKRRAKTLKSHSLFQNALLRCLIFLARVLIQTKNNEHFKRIYFWDFEFKSLAI